MNETTMNKIITVTRDEPVNINGHPLNYWDKITLQGSAHFIIENGGELIGKCEGEEQNITTLYADSGDKTKFVGHKNKMIIASKKSDIVIKNLIIEGKEHLFQPRLHRGILFSGCRNVSIVNCTFNHIAHSGITISGEGTDNICIEDCTFLNIAWEGMDHCNAQGFDSQFKIDCSTFRPNCEEVYKWLEGRWGKDMQQKEKFKKDGAFAKVLEYRKYIYPMDVGYLHGIYLRDYTPKSPTVIRNCNFSHINYGFGVNIAEVNKVKVESCDFRNLDKICVYAYNASDIEISQINVSDCSCMVGMQGAEKVLFQDSTGTNISYYPVYSYGINDNQNFIIRKNNINGCGYGLIGCIGGGNWSVSQNQVSGLITNRVWDHFRSNREYKMFPLRHVTFENNHIEFVFPGNSVFNYSGKHYKENENGFGSDVYVKYNTFYNVNNDFSYGGLTGAIHASDNTCFVLDGVFKVSKVRSYDFSVQRRCYVELITKPEGLPIWGFLEPDDFSDYMQAIKIVIEAHQRKLAISATATMEMDDKKLRLTGIGLL